MVMTQESIAEAIRAAFGGWVPLSSALGIARLLEPFYNTRRLAEVMDELLPGELESSYNLALQAGVSGVLVGDVESVKSVLDAAGVLDRLKREDDGV